MSADRWVRHFEQAKIRDLLIGHRIVAAETEIPPYGVDGRLTLDNGTQIRVVPNMGCGGCSNGNYSLRELVAVDNVITAVNVVAEESTCVSDPFGFPTNTYRIFVYADNAQINLATISGSDGNGYYGTGFQLVVEAPL